MSVYAASPSLCGIKWKFRVKIGNKGREKKPLVLESNLEFLRLCQEMYLQHMIRSMLKQLQLGERDQTLLSFVDKAMRVEERKKLLESHHSQELSLLYILQEDYDRARYYTSYAMQLFMEVCSSRFLVFVCPQLCS